VAWGTNASPLFGATFFTITGFHLLHVLSGLIYLAVMATHRSATREAVEICGLYWQFVDAVWLIIFPAIYLFSMK
jgi:cytochrome c oxidase subunit 3